jgi:hypothetical protein
VNGSIFIASYFPAAIFAHEDDNLSHKLARIKRAAALGEHNEKPKPFVRKADPNRILSAIERGKQA